MLCQRSIKADSKSVSVSSNDVVIDVFAFIALMAYPIVERLLRVVTCSRFNTCRFENSAVDLLCQYFLAKTFPHCSYS